MESVLIAGGTGLIGRHLSEMLETRGFDVHILTRNRNKTETSAHHHYWDPYSGFVQASALRSDYIINLSGAGIADRRWTTKRKKSIFESRTFTTKTLINVLARRRRKIKSFINASAIGFYGDGGTEWIAEDSEPRSIDFLSEVCQVWEHHALGAKKIAESVSILRIGTVLSKQGGALSKMIRPLEFGISNYFGSGKQYMSWIHYSDLCRLIIHCLSLEHKCEIFNATSPDPQTSRSFAKTLSRVSDKKKLVFGVPKLVLKAGFGEMSGILLNSTRLSVQKIQDTGFRYEFGKLDDALAHLMREDA